MSNVLLLTAPAGIVLLKMFLNRGTAAYCMQRKDILKADWNLAMYRLAVILRFQTPLIDQYSSKLRGSVPANKIRVICRFQIVRSVISSELGANSVY
jgi:hypothetical protein